MASPRRNRGKAKDLKGNLIWIYGYYVFDKATDCHYIFDETDNLRPWIILPETAGLFFGKNDKNGREIFEGDKYIHIDLLLGKETKGVVEWTMIENSNDMGDFYEGIGFELEESVRIEEIEVIGTIHD